VDLAQVSRMPFEKVDDLLAGCNSAIVCPDMSTDSPEALEAARLGMRAILASAPNEMKKLILLSRIGAQDEKGGFNLGSFFGQDKGTSWANLEDELTSTVRLRSSSSSLRVILVRLGTPLETASASEVACFPANQSPDGSTSDATAAAAVFQALACGVDSSFCVVDKAPTSSTSSTPDWSELLLPFVGPEIWREEVDNASRAAIFVQSWADEFFGERKSALRQGVKTPVQLRSTPSGVIFKFRPIGTTGEENFDSLNDGGIEFIAEEPREGPPRLRARRCAYGWKVPVKENSEQALLSKFKKDWAEVSAS